jgi:hypothetical protein
LVLGAALGTLIEVTLVASSAVIVRGQRGFRQTLSARLDYYRFRLVASVCLAAPETLAGKETRACRRLPVALASGVVRERGRL